MPRLLSSYAANKRVEDGLKRKQEQIRIDYMKAAHRHLDETEKLVDDLIHINVRTPSAFQLRPHTVSGSGSVQSLATSSHSVPSSLLNQPATLVPHHHQYVAKDAGVTEKRLSSTGISPLNFRTELGTGKTPGHPAIQIRGNEVFYQYQKQRRNWKKVEASYKTKLLLHRNNTVIKALSHFNSRQDELSDSPGLEDSNSTIANLSKRKGSAVSESVKRDSIFSRRRSRRESRLSYLSEDKDSVPQVVEIPPQLSPGHTPRMLDGWTIMKWCLWNKKQITPVWATKRYADMKNREYKQFIASKKRIEEQDAISAKPNSANAAQRNDQGRKESLLEDNKLLVPRAKSVPIGKLKTIIDEDTEHLPSIDRGIIRPTTSILRTNDSTANTPEVEEPRPKTTSRRRVALDTFIDENLYHKQNSHVGENNNFSVDCKNSKDFGRSDGKSVSIYAWDTLDETEKETSDEDN